VVVRAYLMVLLTAGACSTKYHEMPRRFSLEKSDGQSQKWEKEFTLCLTVNINFSSSESVFFLVLHTCTHLPRKLLEDPLDNKFNILLLHIRFAESGMTAGFEKLVEFGDSQWNRRVRILQFDRFPPVTVEFAENSAKTGSGLPPPQISGTLVGGH
jgi:hypothetical protein